MSDNVLEIHDDRFNRYIYVFDDPDEFKKALSEVYERDYLDWSAYESKDLLEVASCCTEIFNPKRRYDDILMYFNPRRIESNDIDYFHDLIVHETNHAAVQVLYSAGVDISYDNMEAMAYQHEFIIRKVRNWMLDRWDVGSK